jgi:hypothetical protein
MALWRSSRTSIDTAHRASLSEACRTRRWGQMVLQDKLCKRCHDVADLIVKAVSSRWAEGFRHRHDKRWRWGATGAKVYQPLTMQLSRKTNWRAVRCHMKISCIKCKGVPGVAVVAQPECSWRFQATVAHCNNAWGLPWACKFWQSVIWGCASVFAQGKYLCLGTWEMSNKIQVKLA